jgi:hypothetical protein
MNESVKMYRVVAVLLLISSVSILPGYAHGAKKTVAANVVDSGTFGVYIRGQRVASEKFEIFKTADMSVAKSELTLQDEKNPQKAELQMSPEGNLIRYTWEQSGKGTAVVEPKNEFLVEHVSLSDTNKKAEQPFVLPTSTMVLDDGFFSQRELLLWRYLATHCEVKPGATGCPLRPEQYGVIVPRQQTSMQVTVEYKGAQKVNIKGVDMELQRFQLSGDGFSWTIWIDSAYKVQKIAIEDQNTEVLRD